MELGFGSDSRDIADGDAIWKLERVVENWRIGRAERRRRRAKDIFKERLSEGEEAHRGKPWGFGFGRSRILFARFGMVPR